MNWGTLIDDLGLSQKSKLSQRGMALTKDFEGFEELPYIDSRGKLTSGYGFNLEEPHVRKLLSKDYLAAVEGDITKDPTLTETQAEPIFKQLYQKAQDDAITYLGNQEAFDKLDDDMQDNLVDMSYNLGLNELKKFTEMRKGFLKKDKGIIAKEMKNSKWYKQTGRRGRYHVESMQGKRDMLDLSMLNLFHVERAEAEKISIDWASLEQDLGITGQVGEDWSSLESDLGLTGTQDPGKREYWKHVGKEFEDDMQSLFIQPYKSFIGSTEGLFVKSLQPLATAYDFYADIISKKTGIGDVDKKRWLEKVKDSYQQESAKLLAEGMPEYEIDPDDPFMVKIDKASRNITKAVVEGAGGLAWKIPELMSMAKFLSVGKLGSLTLAVTEGLEATPEGSKEAATQFALGYGFQGIVKGISILPRAIQLPVAFTTFGGVAVASGSDYAEAIGSGMLGVGVSLMGRAPSMKEFRSRYADVKWRNDYHKSISRRLKAKRIWEYRAWKQDAKKTIEQYGNKEILRIKVKHLLQKQNKNVTDAEIDKAVNDIRNVWGKQVADANKFKQGGTKLLAPDEILGFAKDVQKDINLDKVTKQIKPTQKIEQKIEKTPVQKKIVEKGIEVKPAEKPVVTPAEKAIVKPAEISQGKQGIVGTIPKFKSTNEAVAFGKEATPEQIEVLEAKRAEAVKQNEELLAKKDLTPEEMQAGMDLAVEGQLYREAIEASEGKIKEIPKVEPAKPAEPLVEEAKKKKYDTVEKFVKIHSGKDTRSLTQLKIDESTKLYDFEIIAKENMQAIDINTSKEFKLSKKEAEIYNSFKNKGYQALQQESIDDLKIFNYINENVGLNPSEEKIFYRTGSIPIIGQRSYNYRDNKTEKGISVYFTPKATSFAGMESKNWYYGKGKQVGWGSDSEPLIIPTGKWEKYNFTTRQLTSIWNKAHEKPKLWTEHPLVKSELTPEMAKELSQKTPEELQEVLGQPVSKAIKDEAKRLIEDKEEKYEIKKAEIIPTREGYVAVPEEDKVYLNTPKGVFQAQVLEVHPARHSRKLKWLGGKLEGETFVMSDNDFNRNLVEPAKPAESLVEEAEKAHEKEPLPKEKKSDTKQFIEHLKSIDKSGLEYSKKIEIEETGETVEVTKDVSEILRENDKTKSAYEQFLDCISKL